eukprot:TRINITY_DN12456_c2_g1_i1.p1 TRINITY_DN12456_c2_g1~~TRINITY_DN12456_c2_g1_i1.p1  ORF type:complete len:207 (-),score=69.22 TRINITY_DN12456_c2_g1_i1:61-681(-)
MARSSSTRSSSSSDSDRKKKAKSKEKKEKKKTKKVKKKTKKAKLKKNLANEGDASTQSTKALQMEVRSAATLAKEAGPPGKDVILVPGPSGAFRDSDRPFGLELDGALVVDLMDNSAALQAGVQIGWQVLTVNGKPVEEEAVRVAAKALREAEKRAAAALDHGRQVAVRFRTEDPQHWQDALRNLKRGTEPSMDKKMKKARRRREA